MYPYLSVDTPVQILVQACVQAHTRAILAPLTHMEASNFSDGQPAAVLALAPAEGVGMGTGESGHGRDFRVPAKICLVVATKNSGFLSRKKSNI